MVYNIQIRHYQMNETNSIPVPTVVEIVTWLHRDGSYVKWGLVTRALL